MEEIKALFLLAISIGLLYGSQRKVTKHKKHHDSKK